MRQFTITTTYALQTSEAEGYLAGDPLAPEFPDLILVFDGFVLALSADASEVQWYASLHSLQVAYALPGGDLDQLYLDDEDCLREWLATSDAEIADLIESAVNCTPGYEGQTVNL